MERDTGEFWEIYHTSRLWAIYYVGLYKEYMRRSMAPLNVEMRFLETFLEYAAPICICMESHDDDDDDGGGGGGDGDGDGDDAAAAAAAADDDDDDDDDDEMSLKSLLQRAHHLYFQALMVIIELPFAATLFEEMELYSYEIELMNLDEEVLCEWAVAVAYILHEVKMLNVEITQVYNNTIIIFIPSSSSPPMMSLSCSRLINFFNNLLLNIKVFLSDPYVWDLDVLLKIQLDALEPKILLLTNFLMFIKGSCSVDEHENDERLTDFYDYATYLAYNVASLSHSCFITKTFWVGYLDGDIPQLTLDKDMLSVHRLASCLSEVVCKIDPVVSTQARQIYSAVLQASLEYPPSPHLNNASLSNTVVAVFLEFLVESITKLLSASGCTAHIRDQIQMLLSELAFLTSFLKHPPDCLHDVLPGALTSVLSRSIFISRKVGSMISQLFDSEMAEETTNDVCPTSSLANLVEEIQAIKTEIKPISVQLLSEVQFPKFPTTHELGSLHHFLRNLKELIHNNTSSITNLYLPIETLFKELQILESFLRKNENGGQEAKQLWSRIMEVACKAEFMIDSIVARCQSASLFLVWLPIIHEEIRSLKAEVDQIGDGSENKVCYGNEIAKPQVSLPTNFLKLNESTVGYKDVEERIIEDLVGESRKLEMVAIIGMGGQGKTHLANKIYNHPHVKHYFDVCAWCYVSPNFARKSLLAHLVSQIQGSGNSKNERISEQELAEALYKSIKGRRYFIVMDDLWDVETFVFLKRSFPDDRTGSRIMYTSRQNLDLETKFGIKPHPHFLRPISDDESWQLLQERVFPSGSFPSELLELGKQIAKACKGLPLAIVVAAGILARIEKEQVEWSKIVDNLHSHILHDEENNGKEVVKLSYDHLPNYLKPCFLYVRVIEKNEDGHIRVEELIRSWVAEGFVHDIDQGRSLEDIADEYLVDLVHRSLLIVERRHPTGRIKECRIHDLVYDFLLLKAEEENFLSVTRLQSDIAFRQCQWRICSDHHGEILFSDSCVTLPHLRSLRFYNISRNDISSICSKFRLLNVLKLNFPKISSFPGEIVSLVHLRLLSISGSLITTIPTSIANLWKLETLVIRTWTQVKLPHTVWNMRKLRHLDISYSAHLEGSPVDRVLQLENLQTMRMLYLSNKDDIAKLMKGLGNVKHLGCQLGIDRETPETSYWLETPETSYWLVELSTLVQLQSLDLKLQSSKWSESYWLSLPSSLKELRISGQFQMPWKKLHTVIGKLQKLEVLELCENAFKGGEWDVTGDDGDHFLNLKFLMLEALDIKKWSALEADCFPRLQQVVLRWCNQLEEIPSCLGDIPTLKSIQVSGCRSCLEAFVKQIKEEQLDVGNEDFEVIFKYPVDIERGKNSSEGKKDSSEGEEDSSEGEEDFVIIHLLLCSFIFFFWLFLSYCCY